MDCSGATFGDADGVALDGDWLDAALMALSGRTHLNETIQETAEVVVRHLGEDHFLLRPEAAELG